MSDSSVFWGPRLSPSEMFIQTVEDPSVRLTSLNLNFLLVFLHLQLGHLIFFPFLSGLHLQLGHPVVMPQLLHGPHFQSFPFYFFLNKSFLEI